MPEWDPELRARFERPGGLGQVFNVMKTLANHTGLFKRWVVFANHFLFKSSLTPRDRELLILRTGWLAGCDYEWGQHLKIASDDAQFGEREFDALAEGEAAALWTPAEAALIRAADQLHRETILDDEIWDALSQRYNTQQLMDIVFTVGQYRLVSSALNSLCIQLDAYLTPFAA